MKTIPKLFLISLICISFLFTGCKKENPAIVISKQQLSFNSTCIGNTCTQSLTISNTGDGKLILSTINIEGDNKDAFISSGTCDAIEIDGTCTINIRFTPEKLGENTASLVINSNDRDQPVSYIELEGWGLPSKGLWEGEDLQFFVSTDGSKLTTQGSTLYKGASLSVSAEGYVGGGHVSVTCYYFSEISIENLEFHYTSTEDDITGTFSEDNVCDVSGWTEFSLGLYDTYKLSFNGLTATPNNSKSILSQDSNRYLGTQLVVDETSSRIVLIKKLD